MSRTVLVADVHLSAADRGTVDAFLGALPAVATGARQLFLLGDLFDAWVGDDLGTGDQDALAREVAAALRALAGAGTAIAIGHGNRDFLIGERYAAACGATLLPGPTVVTLAGEPTLLAHGDELCTDDVEYQRLRTQLRAPAWQAAFLEQPRAARREAARRLRGESESAKRAKADAIMDVNVDAVAALMRRYGVRSLVHGHTHRPAMHAFVLDGAPAVRRVLPDWDAGAGRGGFLVADARGWEAVDAFGPDALR